MIATHERCLLVLTTTASEEHAASLARALVERGLAACVNVLPGISSVYRWKGEIAAEAECLLLVKTAERVFPALSEAIRELHTYEVPEIVAVPIAAGDPAYLAWLSASLGTDPA